MMTVEQPDKTLARVALICPFTSGPTRGNITTFRRLADHLPNTGCQVTTIPLDTMLPAEQLTLLNQVRPHLLHAFHAFHAGPAARRIAHELGVPYLITITGSDLFDATMCHALKTRQAMAEAVAVTCFDPLVARRLTEAFPDVVCKLTVIPQGVAPLPVAKPFLHAADEFLILLPAAMRPVKGITSALDALTSLAVEFPSLRLLVAGGSIDPDYAAEVRERVSELSWALLLGDVPHHQMGALYAAADLVLNASLFEGGMANALLEAMVMGRPVLARDVVGNRSLIRHGETGWLYGSDDELRELVRLTMRSPDRCRQIGKAGRNFVREHCSPVTEAESYAAVYQQVIRGN